MSLIKTLAFASLVGSMLVAPLASAETLVGGDKDAHGCIGSAGYTWCAAKEKCLRTWEEACVAPDKTTCVKQAIDTRDTSLSASWDIYSAAIKKAFDTRREALKAAWNKSTAKEVRTATNQAWKVHTTATRVARAAWNKSKQDAWKKFNTDNKACKSNTWVWSRDKSADAGL